MRTKNLILKRIATLFLLLVILAGMMPVTVIIRYFVIDPLNYPHKKEYRMTDTGTSHGYETVGQYFSRMHICFTPEYSIEYNPYQTINDDRTIYVWDWGTGPETDMSLYR